MARANQTPRQLHCHMERWLEFPRECLCGQDIMATEKRKYEPVYMSYFLNMCTKEHKKLYSRSSNLRKKHLKVIRIITTKC